MLIAQKSSAPTPSMFFLKDTTATPSTTRYNMLDTRNPRILNQVFLKFFFFFTYILLQAPLCNSIDTMKMSDQFLDTQGDSIESATGVFRLGFFALGAKRYVGVWYLMDVKTVVWVANRENPILDDSGVLRFDVKGNLVLSSQHDQSVWSIDPDNNNIGYRKNMTRKLQLLDSGNLVVSEVSQDGVIGILWESFENPTDTFLPGMKMKQGMQLTSWKGPVDPAPGDFTFLLQEQLEGQYMIQNKSFTYWISGVSEDFSNESYDVPYAISSLLSNTTKNNVTAFSRVRILSNGTIQHLTMDNETTSSWDLLWFEPSNPCRVFDVCGDYGICNSENRVKCRCLPGFQPEEPDNWNSGQFSEGCRRNSSICDGSKTRFLELNMMRFGKQQGGIKVDVANESICKDKCLDGCKCEAYSYTGNQSDGGSCWIWSKKLNNVQEYVDNNGYNLNIRVVLLPGSKWKCEPCGTNIIPYPLSINKNCGDPAYSGFICNRSSGQLYVGSPPNLYRITGIDETIRKFYIQVDTTVCPTNIPKLNMSQFLISNCSSAQSGQLKNIEIEWKLPKEPPCNSTEDCSDWSNTLCSIDGHGSKRCFCKRKFKWDSSKNICTAGSGILKMRYLFFLITLPILTTIICCIIIYVRKRQENRKSRLYDSQKRIKGWINSVDLGEEDNTDISKLSFNIFDILKATNNFSNQNKLGQGGFGPVYKGVLLGGEEIAVKRLLSDSGQGLQELKNEVMLIAKLQHRNLVRLLGYCIEGDEKLLLYEYMPNKSLDSFLFDRTRCILLTWDLRKEIILGIARGMLYLHQDSRLRIIHRDLKPSNILLDEDMNPKISDFGLARIFQGKQTEASTKRVIGTYGYMSPEYALEGYFSVKSDVYSYGVVVLEIISGRKNTSFYNPEREGPLNLISYAWSLWKEDDAINLLDQTVSETCNKEEAVKYLKLALLCVQDDPSDRPTMSSIVFTLGNDNVTLPSPRQPAFVTKRSVSSKASSLDEPGTSLEISTSLELNI